MTTHLEKGWLLLTLFAIAFTAMPSPGMANEQDHQPGHADLTETLTNDDARHLLMRTGIGARPEDVIGLIGLSRMQAIDSIIDGMSIDPEVPMPDWVNHPLPAYYARPDMDSEARSKFNNERNAELAQLREWWVLNILQTASPQTERMVLFWHDLFATNYKSLDRQSLAMARQNQTFRRLGFGSWELLIKAMIRDAALLEFLNSGSNHKKSPNENLARELMELFVLGEGHFDEATVREAARSLTGHDTSRFHNLQFQLKTWAQDRNDKQLFGETGAFDGDDLVDFLLQQDAAPRFLVKRFWHAFVSDVAPEAEWVSEQALHFRQSELDIETLYRNVLQSEAFWHEDNRGAMIKSPVDIVAGTARTLHYPMAQWKKMPAWQRLIGMDLFAPPNVSGWKEGAAFITPGHLLNRYKIVGQLTRPFVNKKSEGDSAMTMASTGMQMMSDANENNFMAEQNTTTMQADNGKQGNTLMPAAQPGVELDRNKTKATLQASAVHIQWGAANKKNGKHTLEIVLDHLQTPEKFYQHVRFTIEKKRNEPMMLQLDSFSCWPDCVDPWPACSWVDENFTHSKHITLPWVPMDHERWSSAHDHQCHFDSLARNEKVLVSTLWDQVPTLLARVKPTNRVQRKRERWLPIIEFFEEQQNQAPEQIADTAYAPFVRGLDLSAAYAPPAAQLQPLSAPLSRVADIQSLMVALSTENLAIHDLLLPRVADELVPDLPASDVKRPGRYLKTVLEHPLFQLK